MTATTIKIHKETKAEIDKYREYKNESYDELLRKILFIVKSIKKDPNLSKETIKAIEDARKRMDKGHFYTEEEAKKILGLA
jgi:predicted transcriptional regulator